MLTGAPSTTLASKESKDVGGEGKGVMVETFDPCLRGSLNLHFLGQNLEAGAEKAAKDAGKCSLSFGKKFQLKCGLC